jgi:hypothetical protein
LPYEIKFFVDEIDIEEKIDQIQSGILIHHQVLIQTGQKVDVEIRAVPAFILNILQLKLFIE